MKVVLSGKELVLTFGMMAAEEVASRQMKGSSGWVKLITDIVWAGYINEIYLSGNDPELDYRKVSELVDDELEGNVLASIFDAFMDSKGGKKMLPLVEGEDSKKKKVPTGTKSKDSPSED